MKIFRIVCKARRVACRTWLHWHAYARAEDAKAACQRLYEQLYCISGQEAVEVQPEDVPAWAADALAGKLVVETEFHQAITASIAPLARVALQCLESGGDYMQLGREAGRLIESLGAALRQLEED